MAILKNNTGGKSSRIKSGELPPKGRYIATCIAIEDRLGVERQKFDSAETEVVDLTSFYFGFKCKQGLPWAIRSREMKISLHENAALFGFLQKWLEKPPTAGFDTASLVGFPAEIRIEHQPGRKDPSRFFSNLSSVLPIDSDDAGKVLGLEVFKDLLHPASAPAAQQQEDGDEIPF